MNKAVIKNILIAFLLALTIFVVFRYILSLRKDVATLEDQRQNLLVSLEKEKQVGQQLAQENTTLKANLVASRKKIAKLMADYSAEQKTLDELKARFALVQAENAALRGEKQKVAEEIEALQGKVDSSSRRKRQMPRVSTEMRKESETQQKISEGNYGYTTKNGKTTYPARIKVEVLPAPIL